jgi:hypothetical protein
MPGGEGGDDGFGSGGRYPREGERQPADDGFELIREKDSHGPIQEAYRKQLNAIASVLDDFFNPTGTEGIVFTVLMARSGDMTGGRVNYISNGDRAEMIEMTEEWLGRVKGSVQPDDCLIHPPKLSPEEK